MYNVKLYFFYKLSYYSKTKQVDRLLIYMLGRREMFNIDVKLTPEDESEVLRYLQHNGKEIDENLHAQVLECMDKINAVAKPNPRASYPCRFESKDLSANQEPYIIQVKKKAL